MSTVGGGLGVLLSADRTLLEEVFPELSLALRDTRNTGWNSEQYVTRFSVNGFCKLTYVEIMERLMGVGFTVEASHGGGVEGQLCSDVLMSRKAVSKDLPSSPSSLGSNHH